MFKSILLGLFISLFFPSMSFASKPDDVKMQRMILHYVNAYRLKHHLSALKLNAAISLEAQKHSLAMANHSIPFGHAYFNDRVQRLYKKLGHCRGAAENVAFYKVNARRLVAGWVASRGHRRNIEGHYNLTGIGIVHGKPGWAYFTQIFVQADNH